MGNQQGHSEFLVTAEELERGVELGVGYEPLPEPVREGRGDDSLSDVYLAVGVALAMVAVLVHSIKGELGILGAMFPSMRGEGPSMGREGDGSVRNAVRAPSEISAPPAAPR